MDTRTESVILAGGQSKRMGANKALLRLSPDGPSLIEVVAERLSAAGLPPSLVVTNTPAEYAFLGVPCVEDDVKGAGPLGGILTALNHIAAGRALVVACDMPALNPALLAYMASLPAGPDAIVPLWHDEQGCAMLESLHAVYSRACIEPLQRRIAEGRLKAAGVLEDVNVRYLTAEEVRRFDPNLDSFRNVNTPEEWRALVGDM